jgi:NADP-dependent 3-hydroxy acid dehydrogenase YdfG
MSESPGQKILTGRVALVTGASSGIGATTAVMLGRAGARVILIARRSDRLSSIRDEIEASGGTATILAADFAKEDDIRRAFTQVEAEFRQLDILINCAGIMLLSPIAEAVIDDWRRMIDINLTGLMISCKLALPLLERSRAGHIVNVASLAGRIANPNAAAYAATKFGVVAFSEALRREVYAKLIRVTVVEPGMVATELGDHVTNKEMRDALKSRLGSIEPLQAIDVAAGILYAVTQPLRVNVNEILLRPTKQER